MKKGNLYLFPLKLKYWKEFFPVVTLSLLNNWTLQGLATNCVSEMFQVYSCFNLQANSISTIFASVHWPSWILSFGSFILGILSSVQDQTTFFYCFLIKNYRRMEWNDVKLEVCVFVINFNFNWFASTIQDVAVWLQPQVGEWEV